MLLSEFRIRNFRSIIDSGWNKLSTDNITALIGQNESGKTSILESLCSFREGVISEDVLRSDITLPEVSCAYKPATDENFDLVDKSRLPEGIIEAIRKDNKLVLTRIWNMDLTNRLYLSGEKISEIFDRIENEEMKLTDTVIREIYRSRSECEEIRRQIKITQEDCILLRKESEKIAVRLSKLNKLSKRSKDTEKLELLKREIQNVNSGFNHINEKIRTGELHLTSLKEKLAQNEMVKEHGQQCLENMETFEYVKAEMEKAYKQLIEADDNHRLADENQRKAGRQGLKKARETVGKLQHRLNHLKNISGTCKRLVRNLVQGMNLAEAGQQANEEYISISRIFTREESGEEFLKCLPRHEFFEDFGSLLPNRIDLDDIYENNNRVEGFKAVRNFLIIAGLDPKFFRQSNNRILKQKIENLNNEVTVDFQEYWCQNIGKENKISINFDLEHYDISHPEKKGKPYLEFWIKDEHERLYPKQRSMGVRWFLSFYLELKAFARQNKNEKSILLIDEPGLSLHARAQEDVLKVFEDIREKVQIIYTTHSPHLIDHNKLYRLLAIERSRDKSEKSETIVFDASHFQSATSDTLSPVSALLGAGFMHQVSRNTVNVIVEDISTFYYMSSLYKLIDPESEIFFLPADGKAGVPVLINLMTGWGFDFSVLLFDNQNNRAMIEKIQLQLEGFNLSDSGTRLILAENFEGSEDLFSTLDFKKHIINKRLGIPETNSGYIHENNISRPLLASRFAQLVATGNFSVDLLDEETRQNIEKICRSVIKSFRIIKNKAR